MKIKGNLPKSFCYKKWASDGGHCSWRIFHSMNFSQMHERLRLELLRRIQRGTLSVSLLARQTGFGQSHISNFLRNRRQLSLEGLDRVLNAQHMSAGDLLPVIYNRADSIAWEESNTAPVVSHSAALFEPFVRPGSIRGVLSLPAGLLNRTYARPSNSRKPWQRFVAVSIPASDAMPMDPVVMPDALILIDRHYNSLVSYRPGRLTIYAVRSGHQLLLRYVDFAANRLVLRPHNLTYPVDVLEIPPGETPGDLLVGRVALILNEP